MTDNFYKDSKFILVYFVAAENPYSYGKEVYECVAVFLGVVNAYIPPTVRCMVKSYSHYLFLCLSAHQSSMS